MNEASYYQQMNRIVRRFAPADGEVHTSIDELYFSRRSSETQPLHTAQWPYLALLW
jgi:hypothetical protein